MLECKILMQKARGNKLLCDGKRFSLAVISWIIDEFRLFAILAGVLECSFESQRENLCLNHNIFSASFQPEKLNVYKNDSDISWDYTLGEYNNFVFAFYDFHFMLSLAFIIRFFFFYFSRLVCY